jgi:hypothetical protein
LTDKQHVLHCCGLPCITSHYLTCSTGVQVEPRVETPIRRERWQYRPWIRHTSVVLVTLHQQHHASWCAAEQAQGPHADNCTDHADTVFVLSTEPYLRLQWPLGTANAALATATAGSNSSSSSSSSGGGGWGACACCPSSAWWCAALHARGLWRRPCRLHR